MIYFIRYLVYFYIYRIYIRVTICHFLYTYLPNKNINQNIHEINIYYYIYGIPFFGSLSLNYLRLAFLSIPTKSGYFDEQKIHLLKEMVSDFTAESCIVTF